MLRKLIDAIRGKPRAQTPDAERLLASFPKPKPGEPILIPSRDIRPIWREIDDPESLPRPIFYGNGQPYGYAAPIPDAPFDAPDASGAEAVYLDATLIARLAPQPDLFTSPEAMPQPHGDSHLAAQEPEPMSTEQKPAPKRRKYHLRHTATDAERIIDATSPAQAVRYASRSDYECELLDADTALRLGAAGIVPETASDEPAADAGSGAG